MSEEDEGGTLHDQVIITSSHPPNWINGIAVANLHQRNKRTYGYATIGGATLLVRRSMNEQLPVWTIVAFVRE